MSRLDYILKHFTANDTFRPALNLPCTIGDYTYASNTHVAIRIENSRLQRKYELPAGEKPINFESFFNGYTDKVGAKKLNIYELLEAVNSFDIELVYKVSRCENCSDGEVLCESCNHHHECEDCEGTGTRIEKFNKPYLKIVRYKNSENIVKNYFLINNELPFNPAFIELLLMACLVTNTNYLIYYNFETYVFFEANEFDILIPKIKVALED